MHAHACTMNCGDHHRIKPETAQNSWSLPARRGGQGFSSVINEPWKSTSQAATEQDRLRKAAFVSAARCRTMKRGGCTEFGSSARVLVMTVADTDVLIDFLAGAEPAAEWVRNRTGTRLPLTTVITRFELLSGVRQLTPGEFHSPTAGRGAALDWANEAADKAAK